MLDRDMNTAACHPSMASQQDCSHQVVAMAYIPWQSFGQVYDPKKALMTGTIFPELDKPFTGRCKGGRCR